MAINLSSGRVGPNGRPVLGLAALKAKPQPPAPTPQKAAHQPPISHTPSLAEMFSGVRTRAEEEAADRRKARKQRVNERVQGSKWLAFTFPALFSKNDVKPLAVGVNKEIMKQARDFIPLTTVKKALSDHVNSVRYQQALSWPCSARYGLDGEITGYVTDEERHYARLRLAARIGRKEPSLICNQ